MNVIASAVTTEDAVVAVYGLIAQIESRNGFSTDLQRKAAPMLARAAVLANRRGLSQAGLRRLLWGGNALTALIDDAVASPNEEERLAALWPQLQFADHDVATSAERNMIMVEAGSLLHS
jgi:hypothetical protein